MEKAAQEYLKEEGLNFEKKKKQWLNLRTYLMDDAIDKSMNYVTDELNPDCTMSWNDAIFAGDCIYRTEFQPEEQPIFNTKVQDHMEQVESILMARKNKTQGAGIFQN